MPVGETSQAFLLCGWGRSFGVDHRGHRELRELRGRSFYRKAPCGPFSQNWQDEPEVEEGLAVSGMRMLASKTRKVFSLKNNLLTNCFS
jgi:hypothetical protein